MDTPQSEFKQLCDQMSDEIMKPFVAQKEHIYIDSDLLYDYRLGAVMSQVTGKEDYDYVVANLDRYLDAPTLECAKFFPKMNLTEEMLDKIIKDPKYYTFINAASPATTLIDDLESIVRMFDTINQSKETTRPLRITVNQRMIEIHPVYKQMIVDKIHSVDPTVIVTFTSYKNWFEVPTTLIERQDFICVYDVREFLMEGTNSQKLLVTVPSKLAKCNIISLLQSDHDNPSADEFHNLRVMLECMCNKFTLKPKTLLQREEEVTNG